MWTRIAGVVTVLAGVAATATGVGAEHMLGVRVSPTVAMAPAHVVVVATVERDSDNRSLEIVASSDSFYRSSVVQLEGDHAPRITQVDLKGLPDGQYEVVVALYGLEGERAVERRQVIVD